MFKFPYQNQKTRLSYLELHKQSKNLQAAICQIFQQRNLFLSYLNATSFDLL